MMSYDIKVKKQFRLYLNIVKNFKNVPMLGFHYLLTITDLTFLARNSLI